MSNNIGAVTKKCKDHIWDIWAEEVTHKKHQEIFLPYSAPLQPLLMFHVPLRAAFPTERCMPVRTLGASSPWKIFLRCPTSSKSWGICSSSCPLWTKQGKMDYWLYRGFSQNSSLTTSIIKHWKSAALEDSEISGFRDFWEQIRQNNLAIGIPMEAWDSLPFLRAGRWTRWPREDALRLIFFSSCDRRSWSLIFSCVQDSQVWTKSMVAVFMRIKTSLILNHIGRFKVSQIGHSNLRDVFGLKMVPQLWYLSFSSPNAEIMFILLACCKGRLIQAYKFFICYSTV